jgi:hypothetical protein
MVTIVLLVSRDTFLNRIFANIDMLEADSETTSLLVYVDGDTELYQKARNLTVNSRFVNKLCIYRRKGLPNVGNIRSRRKRITDIHTEIKGIIQDCDYILLLEDDTTIPLNTLKILLADYADYPYAGFISGVELGRWGYTHIGAWRVNDIYNPSQITSTPASTGLEEIDAAGFYCCLIKRDNYMKSKFEPFDNILGPDVNFGIKLRQSGLKNYVDNSIKCKHLTKRGEITFLNSDIIQVQFSKEGDKWSMKQL